MTRLLAALIALALLAGCNRVSQQLDAAEDVRAFLVAVRAGDRAGFDRHVDRAALKADIQRQAGVRAAAGDPAAALIQTEHGGRLLDTLIGPETFQYALRSVPVLADRTPTAPELAAVLRTLDENRVCLPEGGLEGPCAATFARQGEVWRLVAISASGVQLQNLPFPPSAAG
jgi:hypothetical protein